MAKTHQNELNILDFSKKMTYEQIETKKKIQISETIEEENKETSKEKEKYKIVK